MLCSTPPPCLIFANKSISSDLVLPSSPVRHATQPTSRADGIRPQILESGVPTRWRAGGAQPQLMIKLTPMRAPGPIIARELKAGDGRQAPWTRGALRQTDQCRLRCGWVGGSSLPSWGGGWGGGGGWDDRPWARTLPLMPKGFKARDVPRRTDAPPFSVCPGRAGQTTTVRGQVLAMAGQRRLVVRPTWIAFLPRPSKESYVL